MLNKLKETKIKFGFNDYDMAKMLGISRTFYWQIENGKRKLKYLMAIQISSIFNLRPDDIFYDEFLNIVDNEK